MYTLRIRAYRDPHRRDVEVWDTIDQVVRAYEAIGIDAHTITLGLAGAENKLRERVEAAKQARRRAEDVDE